MTEVRYSTRDILSEEKKTVGSLGYRDEKGRDIGYVIETSIVSWEIVPRDHGPWLESELDELRGIVAERNKKPFVLRVQATRNGKKFGAWQNPRYFASSAIRDAAIIAYVDGARKRAAAR